MASEELPGKTKEGVNPENAMTNRIARPPYDRQGMGANRKPITGGAPHEGAMRGHAGSYIGRLTQGGAVFPKGAKTA